MEDTGPPSSADASSSSSQPDVNIPPSILVLGMAGSGKTSFVQRLTAYLHARKTPPYVINLDPATANVPYPVNIDIRDTVKYKQVMKDYGLGPNGAIITSLNLMCTKFDQVLAMIRQRASQYSVCLIDTPGQIEAFTWSASGSIITDSLANSPSLCVDSARATNPTTFMSNMLYACSILYRTKLPFIVAFNKADIVSPAFARSWMRDFERFDQALEENRSSYMNDLSRSLSLVLEEFLFRSVEEQLAEELYYTAFTVSISSATGEGMDEFMKAVGECVEQYKNEYVPMYIRVLASKSKLDRADEHKKVSEKMEVLSVHPTLDPPIRERIHLGGVEQENAEDANASVLLGRAGDAPTVVEAVQFHGIRITKNDALVKEVSELYRSSTLDELVHNSHLAAKHFQEVGLMESAVPLIDVAPSSNGYIVNFVVKEPKGDHSFNLSFAKPFLGWQKYSNVTASLFRAISYLPWNHSNCEENAIIFGYNGRISKNILHQIKFNTLWRTLRATDDAAFLVREHAGHTTKFSMENAIGFDTRDRPILASKGILGWFSGASTEIFRIEIKSLLV
ncbi:ATP binding protein [Cooperia oncophora]